MTIAPRPIPSPCHPPPNGQCAHSGFTLVELMATVAVAAVMFAIAVPSFTYMTTSNQLTGAANELLNALNTARTQAIKTNSNATVCSDNTCSVTWPTDAQGNALTLDPPIRAGIAGISGSVQIQNPTLLVFNGQGLAHAAGNANPYGGLVADIYSTAITSNNRRCLYMVAGGSIMRTCTITSNGACPNAAPPACN